MQYFVKYLIGILLALGWTAVILLTTPALGRPIISGYVLLLIFISFFQKARAVLFTGLMILLCYTFLLFTYPYPKTLHPILDFAILLLSAGAIILITRNIQKHYANLLKARNKAKEAKSTLEIKVSDRTKELRELSQNLEKKTQERTKALEKTRKALINLLEDAEEAKRKIEEEKNKTRAALISLSDGLIVFNREKKITLANPGAEKIFRVKESEILNKTINEIANTPNLNALYKTLGQKIEWTRKKYELILEKPFKKFFQVSIVQVTVDKATIGLMVILHDITHDKEVDRMKTEFISVAAHQLRTPLSAVKWTLQMILDGDMGKIDSEVKEYLKKSYQSNERMINLVNDLLNISRIEKGHFLYNLELISMQDLIKSVISDSASFAAKQKIKINFNMPKSGIFKIKADYKKIKLAIQNLVDNAMKYSMSGNKVIINLKKIKENRNDFIQVEIKDDGIGISEQEQQRLFSKFFRGENATIMQTDGSGLGLFIVKNIIKAHGGKIWLKSKENQGSTFYIKLPINQQLLNPK
ncbi:MAG: ATP-binding protein [Patescibacteria group bacterium]|nr:ATP-binding protein [Patescibacteria group bacterium]